MLKKLLSKKSMTGVAIMIFFLFFLFPGATARAERQPMMTTALAHLKKAEEALMAASKDKGGHRVAALKLVRKAIGEVKEGIKFDNRH